MHYMTVLVIEYESTAYQQYKMAKKKLGVFFQFFAREATLKVRGLSIEPRPVSAKCALTYQYMYIHVYSKRLVSNKPV